MFKVDVALCLTSGFIIRGQQAGPQLSCTERSDRLPASASQIILNAK